MARELQITVNHNGKLIDSGYEDLPSNWDALDDDEKEEFQNDKEKEYLAETFSVSSRVVESDDDE